MTRLADILGFRKKRKVSEEVISSEAIQPIGISCESTETVLSHFTSHFSQTNPPLTPPLKSEGKKAAFTLAEVLITLGIIGVVAAITMPTLIQNHRKHEIETRLKKVYSTMNQAIEMSIANDTWTPKQSGESDLQYWERAILPYLDGVKVNRSKRTHPYWKNSWVPVELKDGSVLYLASTFIGYDTNGAAGPNKAGIDMFRFRYTYEPKDSTYYKKGWGYFFPSNYAYDANASSSGDVYVSNDRDLMKKYCDRRYTASEASNTCSMLIMYDGWKISDDYPVKF